MSSHTLLPISSKTKRSDFAGISLSRGDHAGTPRHLGPGCPPHPTGGSVDLTLCRAEGVALDMVTTSDGSPADSDTLSYTFSRQISEAAGLKRALLIEVMAAQGFVNYPTERIDKACPDAKKPKPLGSINVMINRGQSHFDMTGGVMLADLEVNPIIAVSDIQRARDFYEAKLGLVPSIELPDGSLMYQCKIGRFNLYPSPNAGTAKNTVMGWLTDDIERDVRELKSRGVVFEEYDFPGFKTVDSIARLPGERGAWFRDSEGNILAIGQFDKPI